MYEYDNDMSSTQVANDCRRVSQSGVYKLNYVNLNCLIYIYFLIYYAIHQVLH